MADTRSPLEQQRQSYDEGWLDIAARIEAERPLTHEEQADLMERERQFLESWTAFSRSLEL